MPRTSRPDHAKARQRTDPLGYKNCDFAIGLGAAAVGFLIGRLFHTT